MIQNHIDVEEPGNGLEPNIPGVSESNLPGDTLGIEYRIYGKNTRKSQEELLRKQIKNNNWGNYKLIDTDTGNRIFLQFKSIITGSGASGKGMMSQGEKRLKRLENGISIRLQLHAIGNKDELQVPKPGTNPAVWDKNYQDEAISADVLMEDDSNEDDRDNDEDETDNNEDEVDNDGNMVGNDEIKDEVDNDEDKVDNNEIEDETDNNEDDLENDENEVYNDEDAVDNNDIEDESDNGEHEMDSDEDERDNDESDNDEMGSDENEVDNGSEESNQPSSSSIAYSSSELLKSSPDDSGFSDEGTL